MLHLNTVSNCYTTIILFPKSNEEIFLQEYFFCGTVIALLKIMNRILKMSMLYFSKNNGNSLMEFAVVTSLMAVLVATAAPKFSDISEKAKFQKSKLEIEKIGKQAVNFFQDTAVKEGRGRFPGQVKYNQKVGGHSSLTDLEDDLLGTNSNPATFNNFASGDASDWVSVFGFDTYSGPSKQDVQLNIDHPDVQSTWYKLFGDDLLNSPFQDGHYVYQVLAGSGSGSQAIAPTIFIADLENPSQINLIIQP